MKRRNISIRFTKIIQIRNSVRYPKPLSKNYSKCLTDRNIYSMLLYDVKEVHILFYIILFYIRNKHITKPKNMCWN